ncbi:MAG: DUF3592 domain-containing protein [Paracoccaceae bacterium]
MGNLAQGALVKTTRSVRRVLGVLGFIFLLAGAGLMVNSFIFKSNALEVTGTVVAVGKNYSDEGGVTYQPTFRFLDAEGNKHRAQTSLSSSRYNYKIGERVDILYDQRDPSNIRVDSWFSVWGFAAIFAVFLGVFGASFLFVTKLLKRKVSRGMAELKYSYERQSFGREVEHAKENLKESRKDRLVSMETAEDHAREENYRPTVRRSR